VDIKKLCPICNKIKSSVYKGRCPTCKNKLRPNNSPLIKCPCSKDCNKMIHTLDNRGRPVYYYKGHKNRYRTDLKGSNHPMWKGGIVTNWSNYLRAYSPNHPYKAVDNKVRVHRLVIEEFYSWFFGVPIYFDPKIYDVHHKDGNKHNNDIMNLELLTKSDHAVISCRNRWNKIKNGA
jgi:hypothetical protein